MSLRRPPDLARHARPRRSSCWRPDYLSVFGEFWLRSLLMGW